MAVILGITGASGAIYSLRLLQVLLESSQEVHLTISDSGLAVLRQELGIVVSLSDFQPEHLFRATEEKIEENAEENTEENRAGGALLGEVLRPPRHSGQNPQEKGPTWKWSEATPGKIHYHHFRDFMAPIASGSFLTEGMVICPCSGTTLSAVAQGSAGNLVQRAAEVQLKERRRLILVTREAPLSLIQLNNMRRVTEAGGIVLPASPGWYHGVVGIGDLVDFVVGRICDQLGIFTSLCQRWGT